MKYNKIALVFPGQDSRYVKDNILHLEDADMIRAKIGDKVSVHYTGSLESGTVLGTSQNRLPVELTLGSADYIQGFEDGIIGMAVGDKKTFIVSPEKAFGLRHMELICEISYISRMVD